VQSLGYTIDDDTVISGDPFNANTASIVNAVLAHAKNGATIIMHVGFPTPRKACPRWSTLCPDSKPKDISSRNSRSQHERGTHRVD
jgi:hypothetical protein